VFINFPKRFTLVLLSAIIIFPLGCNKYSDNPDLRLARDFIDSYYVFANQQKSLGLTTGSARDEINKEIGLLKGVLSRQDSYRSRDVLFELKKEMKSDNEAIFLFELTLIIPDIEDQKRMINR